MRRLTCTAIGMTLALLMVAAMATPGSAAVPGPRSEQWWFTAWQVQNKVWPITQGQGVTVAVIDTGVEADIPDLTGVVLPGTNLDSGSGDGRRDVDTAANAGHGTAMSTLIASQGRGTGFVGVAPEAKILPVVANHASNLAPAIRYAVDHGAKVVNVSQGSPQPCPDDIQQSVGYAIQHNVIVLAGAGNQGNTTNASNAPANCAGVLAVGALDPRLRAFVTTERQPYVTVSAPGADVGGVLRDGQYHTSEGGTSAATALTSGAVALVRSKFPDLSARAVVQRIMASLRDAGPSGKDDATGYGAVRPYQALTVDVPQNTPNPVFAAYDKWAAAHGGQGSGSAGAQGKKSDDAGNNVVGSAVQLGIGTAVTVLVIVLIVFFLRARRRRAAPAAGPLAGYPGQGGPQQPYGRPQGPPPGFGGPPGPPPPQGRPGFPPPSPQDQPPGGPGQGGSGGSRAPYGQQGPPRQPRG